MKCAHRSCKTHRLCQQSFRTSARLPELCSCWLQVTQFKTELKNNVSPSLKHTSLKCHKSWKFVIKLLMCDPMLSLSLYFKSFIPTVFGTRLFSPYICFLHQSADYPHSVPSSIKGITVSGGRLALVQLVHVRTGYSLISHLFVLNFPNCRHNTFSK